MPTNTTTKPSPWLWLLMSAFAILAGCNPPRQNAPADHQTDSAANRPHQHEEQPMHDDHQHHGHQHQHAFSDPENSAHKWNDPQRDAWQRPDEILAALALQPGDTVADIGAGTGYMVAHLSRAVGERGTVVAIDASPRMIEYLTAKSVELGPAQIVPRKVDFDDPQIRPATVDAVLTLDTWHHVAGHEAYAQKVYEGLTPGGRFVVVDHEIDAQPGPPPEMRLAPATVKSQLEAAGFEVEIAKDSMPRHYLVIGHKR